MWCAPQRNFLRHVIDAGSDTESLLGSCLRFRGLFFSILWRRVGFERLEKAHRDRGYLVDCRQKRCFVGLGRLIKPADLPHELKGGSANLFLGYRRIEVE